MSFALDGQFLANSLSTAMKVVGKAPESLTLASSKKTPDKILLRAAFEGRFVSMLLEAAVEKPFRIAVPADRLLALVQKRPVLEFAVNGRVLRYQSQDRKYQGYIELLDAPPVEFPAVAGDEALPMSEALRFAIFDLQNHVSLAPQFVAQEMMLFVDILHDRVRAASGDGFHFAFVEAARDKPEKPGRNRPDSFIFPFRYLPLIAAVFKKQSKEVRVLSDQNNLHIFDAATRVSLPLVEADESGPTMEKIVEMLDGLAEQPPDVEFGVDIDKLKIALQSTAALRGKDAAELLLSYQGKQGLILEMQTTHGRVAETLEVTHRAQRSKSPSIRLEPNMLSDTLARVEGDCRMAFYGRDKCLIERKGKSAQAKYLVMGVAGKED